ncbi:FISUMP domain-containing protein [Pedobacter heparinus]|uniref:FISUMP domain-containing protein n=1 Tax=Pedobacter heparinus TaxID=984 RepID=UPI002930274C|nr:FISUMP domain-containing protein [Pedobacter heparinus]
MKYLFNVLTLVLFLQFSSCVKEEFDLLSPELSDFTITPKFLGEETFLLINPKSKSDGAFIYKVNNSSLISIEGNIVTLKKSGVCTITAIQVASGGYKRDSIQATFPIGALQWPTMSDFTIDTKMLGDAPFELIAPKSNSKGLITYTSSNPDVASIAGKIVSIKSVGKTIITASQEANGIYLAAKINIELVVINRPAEDNVVVDIEGNSYKTIKIGTQTWMMENLKTTHYRNGDPIPNLADQTAWTSDLSGGYCTYSNSLENGATYGKLYNWYAVHNPKGLAPTGWHIPSDAEWAILYNYIGGTRESGKKIQDTNPVHWSNYVIATNETKFSGLPGGNRNSNGIFENLSWDGIWWTDTSNNNLSVGYDLYVKGYIERIERDKKYGFSVRCVKD